MRSRLLKQFIFGTVFLAVIGLIGYGLFAASTGGGSCFDGRQNQDEEGVDCGGACIPCALKNLEAIVISSGPDILLAGNNTTIVFRLTNTNLEYGARSLTYELTLSDFNDAPVFMKTEETFIYPGEVKTIVLPALPIAFDQVAFVNIALTEAEWIAASEFSKPALQVRSVQTERENGQVRIRGVLSNNDSVALPLVSLSAIIESITGKEVSASRTVLQDVRPFEERSFTIFVPIGPHTINLNATRVVAEGRP